MYSPAFYSGLSANVTVLTLQRCSWFVVPGKHLTAIKQRFITRTGNHRPCGHWGARCNVSTVHNPSSFGTLMKVHLAFTGGLVKIRLISCAPRLSGTECRYVVLRSLTSWRFALHNYFCLSEKSQSSSPQWVNLLHLFSCSRPALHSDFGKNRMSFERFLIRGAAFYLKLRKKGEFLC